MKNLSEFLVHLLRRGTTLDRSYLSVSRDHCVACEKSIGQASMYVTYRVCPHCRFHYGLTARERIRMLVDEGSFRQTNSSIASLYPLAFSSRGPYHTRVSQDQTRTGLTEAAITGRCTIGGTSALLVVLDFGFMGGSMGSVVGEKVALAFEMGAKSELPIVALVSGGGTRIQEGVLSLMQMAKTVAAANRLREKRVPFIVVLSNPATGQAYASFANLADLILAEPGSLIGLAPLKTVKEVSVGAVPADAHTAEAHVDHGLLDNLVDREKLTPTLATLLDILGPQRGSRSNGKQTKRLSSLEMPPELETDKAIAIARHSQRPSSLKYIRAIVDDFIELRGDRVSGDDKTIVGGLGYLGGERVVIVAQERRRRRGEEAYHTYPEGFRKARRLIDLAARFNLPVVTLIDTQGAHPGLEYEEQGMGNAIATTLSLMAEVPTPIVSVIVGEGGSEAALALGLADSILMQQYAIYSPVAPGQGTARLSRVSSRTQGEDQTFTLTSYDCRELGIIDGIVPEPEGGAHTDLAEAGRQLGLAIKQQIAELTKVSTKKLLRDRYAKFRNMGEYSSHSQAAMRREISLLQHIVVKEPRGKGGKAGKKEKQEAH